MICTSCARAADLGALHPFTEAGIAQARELPDQLHAACADRCPCQHRDTPSERRPATHRPPGHWTGGYAPNHAGIIPAYPTITINPPLSEGRP